MMPLETRCMDQCQAEFGGSTWFGLAWTSSHIEPANWPCSASIQYVLPQTGWSLQLVLLYEVDIINLHIENGKSRLEGNKNMNILFLNMQMIVRDGFAIPPKGKQFCLEIAPK